MAPSRVQLHDDLIKCNVLPRLPVPALARSAGVCRSWRDLILHDAAFAAQQAQTPSPASVSVACFRRGRMQLLGPGTAAAATPPDPYLSFLPSQISLCLRPCSCTDGLLCLRAQALHQSTFVVGNPATRKFCLVPFDGVVQQAGLAYDPAAAERDGFSIVVAARDGSDRCRFWRFSSGDATTTWRASRGTVRLERYEALQDMPAYAGGRVYWLVSSCRPDVVWYDVAEDRSGTLPLPDKRRRSEPSFGHHCLGSWRGQLRVARASTAGVGAWALAGGGTEPAHAQWKMLHWRRWEEIPGVFWRGTGAIWSVGNVGMETGGEEAVYAVVRYSREHDATKAAVWRRHVVRYDVRAGVAAAVMELGDAEKIVMFDYHSSMAKLPTLRGGSKYHT